MVSLCFIAQASGRRMELKIQNFLLFVIQNSRMNSSLRDFVSRRPLRAIQPSSKESMNDEKARCNDPNPSQRNRTDLQHFCNIDLGQNPVPWGREGGFGGK